MEVVLRACLEYEYYACLLLAYDACDAMSESGGGRRTERGVATARP